MILGFYKSKKLKKRLKEVFIYENRYMRKIQSTKNCEKKCPICGSSWIPIFEEECIKYNLCPACRSSK